MKIITLKIACEDYLAENILEEIADSHIVQTGIACIQLDSRPASIREVVLTKKLSPDYPFEDEE